MPVSPSSTPANVALEYSPPAGTVLHAGSGQILTVSTAATANDNAVTMTVTINVLPVTPTITWASPADIVYGTPLGPAELDAAASVAGTFTYTPAAGDLLEAGAAQTLMATFTPADPVDFQTVMIAAPINVVQVATGRDGLGRRGNLRCGDPGAERVGRRPPEQRPRRRDFRHVGHGGQPGGNLCDHADPRRPERSHGQLPGRDPRRHADGKPGTADGHRLQCNHYFGASHPRLHRPIRRLPAQRRPECPRRHPHLRPACWRRQPARLVPDHARGTPRDELRDHVCRWVSQRRGAAGLGPAGDGPGGPLADPLTQATRRPPKSSS